jgi:hypothetical protein
MGAPTVAQYLYTHINEDGEEYDASDNLDDALFVLNEFPNDSVVITIQGWREN